MDGDVMDGQQKALLLVASSSTDVIVAIHPGYTHLKPPQPPATSAASFVVILNMKNAKSSPNLGVPGGQAENFQFTRFPDPPWTVTQLGQSLVKAIESIHADSY